MIYKRIVFFLIICLLCGAVRASYAQEGFIATIPFQFYNEAEQSPVIGVRIAGRESRFLIDTGSTLSMINQTLATRLGLTLQQALDLKGAPILIAGQPAVGAHLDGLHLASGFSYQGNFIVIKAPKILDDQTPLDGILGADFLKQYTVFIDYRRRRLAFWRQDGFTDMALKRIGMPNVVTVPLIEKGALPFYVSERINGEAQETLLDTGSSSTLIPPSLAHKLNLQVTSQEETFRLEGAFKMNMTRLETLTLGKLDFRDVEVGFAENEVPNLGANILTQCYVLLDPARKRVLLKLVAQVVHEMASSGRDTRYSWKIRYRSGDNFDIWGRTTINGRDSDGRPVNSVSDSIRHAVIQSMDDQGRATIALFDENGPHPSGTRIVAPNGLVMRDDEKPDPTAPDQVRVLQMLTRNLPTPDHPVRVGESWTTELDNGLVKGEKIKMTSTLLGLDEIDGVKAFHVSVQFDLPKTADHSDIIHVKGEYDLDAERGRTMRLDYTMENVDIPQPQGKLNVKILAHSEILPPLPLYENAQAGATPSGSGGKESGKR